MVLEGVVGRRLEFETVWRVGMVVGGVDGMWAGMGESL